MAGLFVFFVLFVIVGNLVDNYVVSLDDE
jgi:hypothetical protein